MKVELDKVKTAAFGVIKTEVADGRLKFTRFTGKQIDYFAKTTENVRLKDKKAYSSAGVNIDFYTDSKALVLKAECYLLAFGINCFADVLVNGELAASDGFTGDRGKIEISLALGEGRKRVTVYFATNYVTELTELNLSDGAEFTPAEKKTKIIFHGDSITQGYYATHPSATYANYLARKLDADGLNLAIGGAIMDENDLDGDVPFSPDKVFVAFGTNDWVKSPDMAGFAERYLGKVARIYPKAELNFITPVCRLDYPADARHNGLTFAEARSALEKIVCAHGGFRLIKGDDLVPPDPSCFYSDLLHPVDKGFSYYSENLYKAYINAVGRK